MSDADDIGGATPVDRATLREYWFSIHATYRIDDKDFVMALDRLGRRAGYAHAAPADAPIMASVASVDDAYNDLEEMFMPTLAVVHACISKFVIPTWLPRRALLKLTPFAFQLLFIPIFTVSIFLFDLRTQGSIIVVGWTVLFGFSALSVLALPKVRRPDVNRGGVVAAVFGVCRKWKKWPASRRYLAIKSYSLTLVLLIAWAILCFMMVSSLVMLVANGRNRVQLYK